MLRFASLFLIILIVVTPFSIFGQKAKADRVSHEFFRLPIHKTAKENRQFRVTARIPFEATYKEALAAHEADVKAAEDEYQAAVQAAADKKSGDKIISKLILDEKPPERRAIPEFHKRNDIPSESELTSKITIQGFKKVQSGGNLIELELSDYDVSTVEKSSGEGSATKKYVEISIRQPIWVKITNAEGGLIYDQTPAVTENAYKTKTTSRSKKDHESYMSGSSYRSFLDGEKRKMRTANLKYLNEVLNSQFGYAWIKRSTPIYTGKHKKYDYSDLDAAQLEAKHGLQDMNIDKEKSTEQLNNALKVWLKVLDEELDSGDKKARINHKVGAGLYINCAVAYIFLKEFDKANEMLNTVEGNDDFKGGDIKEAEYLRDFLNDFRMREESTN